MKQEAPPPRRSRTGIPAIHGGEHVKLLRGAQMITDSQPRSRTQAAIWLSIVLGVALVCAVAFIAVEAKRADMAARSGQGQPFLVAAKIFAHDRYTSTPSSADADIQRFIDETTGGLHDELVASSDPLRNALRLVTWSSSGTVVGTGLEEMMATEAKVLVGVRVDFTSTSGTTPPPRSLLLRLTVGKVAAAYKVSKAEELK
jgi:Mce-associated membrane protein